MLLYDSEVWKMNKIRKEMLETEKGGYTVEEGQQWTNAFIGKLSINVRMALIIKWLDDV